MTILHAEEQLLRSLGEGWIHAPPDAGFDCQSSAGDLVIEVKRARGVRDLHAAMLHLAVAVDEHPAIERAFLIAILPRMSSERVEREWHRVQQVLSDHVTQKLALIALAADDVAALPNDDQTEHIARIAHNALLRPNKVESPQPSTTTSKFFEVWKVLLGSWLSDEGPLQINELADRAGCSYPTVAKALRLMSDRREIERDTSRSVQLRKFPRETLSEVLILADTLRQPTRFVDSTGRKPDPRSILRRLQAKKPQRVALSGVLAAQHYDPHFDLHGIPRIDVVMHSPLELSWVGRVDPALKQAPRNEPAPVLVVRPVIRPSANFVDVAEYDLPVADAVETLLDLYELRLDQQAEELVKALRGKGEKK